MTHDKRTKVHGGISVPPDLWKHCYGFEWKNPVTTDIDTIIKDDMWVEKTLHERYPDLPIGAAEPQPGYALRMYGFDHLFVMAYGAPLPKWDTPSVSFWHDRDAHTWEWVKTLDDVARIEIPDWGSVPSIRETVDRYHQFQAMFPGENVTPSEIIWPYTDSTGTCHEFVHFLSFIDMGPKVFGIERFFEILASEDKLAHALMDKCFEISCSLSEFLLKLIGKTEVKGLMSFGGDYSFFFSPDMYREYGLGFDEMLLERYGRDLPANLHSCGASPHLYEVFSEYTNPILLMQTRGIPGKADQLRNALPYTHLEITIGPPQFEPGVDNIKDAVMHYIEAVGGHDVSISMVLPYMGDKHDSMVREFYAALDEWNSTVL